MFRFVRTVMLACTVILVVGCQYLPGAKWLELRSNDPRITASVHQVLKNNPNLAPFTFHVETAAGIVYLSGYVKTIRQSDTAEMIVKKVSGVRGVENNIIVRK